MLDTASKDLTITSSYICTGFGCSPHLISKYRASLSVFRGLKPAALRLLREHPQLLRQTLQSESQLAFSEVSNVIRRLFPSLQKQSFVWFGIRLVIQCSTNDAAKQLLLNLLQLGVKDPKIKEWWCNSAIQDIGATDPTCLKPEDIDKALESCTHQLWFKDSTAFGEC